MRRILAFILILCFGFSLEAATTRITATVTITNGTSQNFALTVNGDTRTFVTNVTLSTQILADATTTGSKTNAYKSIGLKPFIQVAETDGGSNVFNLVGVSGLAMSVTILSNWATVVYSTQTVATAYDLRLPITVETPAEQTNIASLIPAAIDLSTNAMSQTDTALSGYVNVGQVQTVSGNKAFTGTSNYLNSPYLKNPSLTNGLNYGNPFRSPGSSSGSEQFGTLASASAANSTALGHVALATGQGSVALGDTSFGGGVAAVAVGNGAQCAADGTTALGGNANASGTNSSSFGWLATAANNNSTAIGQGATTSRTNQVVLGTSAERVDVPGSFLVSGGEVVTGARTNATFSGQTSFQTGTDVAFSRYALTSLANGNNADIPVLTNVFVEVSGPSGAFTINGIASPRDGRFLIILNQTGQNMTIAHDSGVEPTAANRIYTMTGADRATTGNGAAILIYSSAAARWILISLDL